MHKDKNWTKTALTLLVGILLGLAIHGIGDRWSRRADAATIDQLARNTIAQLIQAIPFTGGEKIRGVAGLGDGRTFIIHTDEQIYFYQLTVPTRQ